MENPGHFIKQWRKYRNLTQQQVADRVELDKSSVSRIETGKVEYYQSTLEAFAFALGVEPADLLRPPPSEKDQTRNELAEYVLSLDQEQQQRALRILRAALPDDDAAVA